VVSSASEGVAASIITTEPLPSILRKSGMWLPAFWMNFLPPSSGQNCYIEYEHSWVTTLCSLIDDNRGLEGISAYNMETVGSSKAMVTDYHSPLCHDTEDCNLTPNYTFFI
jgi:hypothetical protein